MRDSVSLRAALLPRPWVAVLGVICSVALAAAPRAEAAACGDYVGGNRVGGNRVGGERVACTCGDNVVSDTVLWPTDPVVSEPCSGDGLVILAPSGSDGITLNLGGQSIQGSGHGAGIRVSRGGRLGSVIVGGDADDTRAEIARFATGILASGRSELREVKAVNVHSNVRDGLSVRSSGVKIEDVKADDNGRRGIAVSGHGNKVVDVEATDNARDGLQVQGTGSTISAETSGNRRNGTVVGGRGNQVLSVRSTHNGAAGVRATGANHEIATLDSADNAGGDIGGRPGATK